MTPQRTQRALAPRLRFATLLLVGLALIVLAWPASTEGGETQATSQTFAYVSAGGEGVVVVYKVDAQTGALSEVQRLNVGGAPGAQATNPDQSLLYVALRNKNSIATLKINPQSGKLTPQSVTKVFDNPVYLFVDAAGKWIFVPSYGANKAGVYPLAADGSVKSEAAVLLETDKNPHSMRLAPDGRFAFIPCTGADKIWQLHWNTQPPALNAKLPGPITVGEGDGPRHFTFHPNGRWAYFVNEKSDSVTAFDYNSQKGSLTPLETLSTLPEGFEGNNTCADIHITPSGKFLYASNRGHDSLAGYRVNAETGRLQIIGQFPTEKTPREFAIDPSGRFVYAAGQNSGKLAAYEIDPDSGELNRFATYEVGKGPAWVEVLTFPAK